MPIDWDLVDAMTGVFPPGGRAPGAEPAEAGAPPAARREAEAALVYLGGPSTRCGYRYAADILEGILLGTLCPQAVMEAYRQVAARYGIAPGSVERGLHSYITDIWEGDNPRLHAMFHNRRPSNREFLATVHDWLLIRGENW